MAEPAARSYSHTEYMDFECSTLIKHEFVEGEVRRIAESPSEHALIIMNVYGTLYPLMKRTDCRAYASDLRIGVSEGSLYTYADATVVCGPILRGVADRNAVMNAAVIFEVLSDSTEAYDRGEKFLQYRQIPTFRDYVLISQHRVLVEHFRKGDDGTWNLRTLSAEDSLKLDRIGVEIAVAEIYDGVELEPDTRVWR